MAAFWERLLVRTGVLVPDGPADDGLEREPISDLSEPDLIKPGLMSICVCVGAAITPERLQPGATEMLPPSGVVVPELPAMDAV